MNGFYLLRTGSTIPHNILSFCAYLPTVIQITRIGLLDLLLGCFSV
jgi:hypothetical protein